MDRLKRKIDNVLVDWKNTPGHMPLIIKGARLIGKTEAIRHYNSVQITPIDTNGAGDTFHGAFLAAYAEGMTVDEACRLASAVAAYKCTHVGAREYELNMEIAKKLIM